MKRIITVAVVSIFIFGCMPEFVLSQDTVAPPQKAAADQAAAKAKLQAPPKYDIPARTAANGMPLTVADCYRLALIQSEIIAINTDLIKEADAHFLVALSTIVPHVSFISTDFSQRKSSGSSTLSAINTASSSKRQFAVTQTLFNGFKAIAAMKGTGYERTQRINEKMRAEQLLLVDVSNAFYLLLEERDDLKALYRIRAALDGRVKELIARKDIGRSKPSEVVNAKTQLYAVESTIEVVKSQEVIARQLLEFLIGGPVKEIVDTYKFPDTLMSSDYYVSRANFRPDVEATKFAWQVSKENIRVADSDFLPEVDLSANYYAQRTGISKGIDWDVTLSVNVPIFDGTEVLGRSKEANLKADESLQEYKRTKRHAPYDIKDSYVRLQTAMTVRDALRKAYTTAKLNYHLQKIDYERNQVNNLDVLAAIQSLLDNERNYIHASYEAKRQYWELRVAVGKSGTESLDDVF